MSDYPVQYAKTKTEHRRLILLQVLYKEPNYSASHPFLQEIAKQMGYGASSEVILNDLSQLAEVGCVTLDSLPSMNLAKLTGHGVDVVCGVTSAIGVARPRPEDIG